MRTLPLTVLALSLAIGGACRAQDPPPRPMEIRERAFAAEHRGKFADAADAFLQLVAAEPKDPAWVVAAGRCLGRSGRFKEAVELLDRARTSFPGSLDVPSMLAKTLLMQSETSGGALHPEILWADAAELAEGVLQKNPDDEDSLLVLAQARYLLGDHDAAVTTAEDAVRRHPKRAGAHVLIGRIAGDRFRRLLAQHAREKPTGQADADLVAAIDAERQRAKRAYERAAELDPTRAHPHIALGQLALLDRRVDVARQHFVDAIVLDPDTQLDHAVFELETDWKQRRDVYAEATRRYEAAPSPVPEKLATLRWYEGRARYDGGDWAGARACFADALAKNPQATNTDYYLALCAYRLGDHDAAETHASRYASHGAASFADVIRVLPGDTRGETGAIVQFLADRAFEKGRIGPSRDLNHVIACLKDSADAWNNHAFLCRETGKFEAALSWYLHAQEKEPDSPQLLNDTAVILQYHLPGPEHLQKAKVMYERAVQCADKVLADTQAEPLLRERAAKAKKDALANLATMK